MISTSNHIRAIWDKLLEYVFENFEITQVKRGQFQDFQKSRGGFLGPNQTCDYWLIQALCTETNIF